MQSLKAVVHKSFFFHLLEQTEFLQMRKQTKETNSIIFLTEADLLSNNMTEQSSISLQRYVLDYRSVSIFLIGIKRKNQCFIFFFNTSLRFNVTSQLPYSYISLFIFIVFSFAFKGINGFFLVGLVTYFLSRIFCYSDSFCCVNWLYLVSTGFNRMNDSFSFQHRPIVYIFRESNWNFIFRINFFVHILQVQVLNTNILKY